MSLFLRWNPPFYFLYFCFVIFQSFYLRIWFYLNFFYISAFKLSFFSTILSFPSFECFLYCSFLRPQPLMVLTLLLPHHTIKVQGTINRQKRKRKIQNKNRKGEKLGLKNIETAMKWNAINYLYTLCAGVHKIWTQ